MLKLFKNGIVIQEKISYIDGYKGIEGFNWPLNFKDKNLKNYFDKNIQKSYFDLRYIDCSNDMFFIKKYIEQCKVKDIKYKILFCETTRKYPFFKDYKKLHLKFIGYDYAYQGGSYYSCVNNDIVSKRINEFKNIELNEFGLFDNEKKLVEYIKLRKILVKKYPENYFEIGDFAIYKLSEVLNIESLF